MKNSYQSIRTKPTNLSAMTLLFATFFSLPACAKKEFIAPQIEGDSARLQVNSRGFGDYFTRVVRIEAIADTQGNKLYERTLFDRYKHSAILNAPATYTVRLLCEKPYLLQFHHPTLTIDVMPGQHYAIDCNSINGKSNAIFHVQNQP